MANATLRRLVTEYGGTGEAVIDHLIKYSGILKTANVIPSTHGTFHKYKTISALPTGSFRSLNGGYTDQTINEEVKQRDLKLVGAVQSEDKALCEEIGVAKYFMDNRPIFMEGLGQTIVKQILYGTDSTFGNVTGFTGLHQIAKANSKVIQATGTTGSRTTIFAVRYHKESGLLVNGKILNNLSELIVQTVLNNGQPVLEVVNTTTGEKKPVYQVLYEAQLAWQSASVYDVAAYTQLADATDKRPTAANIDKLVDYVRGSSSDTFLYANRDAIRMIGMLKDSKLQLGSMDNDYQTKIDFWNTIPLVIEDNISSVETTVLD